SQVSRLSHSPPSRARRGQSVLPNIRSRKSLPMGYMRLTRKFATKGKPLDLEELIRTGARGKNNMPKLNFPHSLIERLS
ncbi:hypothetical protein ACC684_38890, partial [Rhizobium ruizarguesonis]